MFSMPASGAVLITGCSSGIGRAAAERLAGRGHRVYATARRPESIADLAAKGCQTLALDVTDESSMRAAVAEVEAREGAVGVLVNNAGFSQSGAIESLTPEQLRAQFDTNVFGLVRMCQLVLPGMRRQRSGRIVNVGSMAGRLTFPGAGAYHATKHAVEAVSDALRFEVRRLGVDVVLIEPGYRRFHRSLEKNLGHAYRGRFAPFGGDAGAVATTIERAISARRPRARYLVTPSARLVHARRVLPDRAWDLFMRTQFPEPVP